jgi:hypothetical protein
MSITKVCTVHVIAKLWPKLYAKITFNHEKEYLKWPNKFSGSILLLFAIIFRERDNLN